MALGFLITTGITKNNRKRDNMETTYNIIMNRKNNFGTQVFEAVFSGTPESFTLTVKATDIDGSVHTKQWHSNDNTVSSNDVFHAISEIIMFTGDILLDVNPDLVEGDEPTQDAELV